MHASVYSYDYFSNASETQEPSEAHSPAPEKLHTVARHEHRWITWWKRIDTSTWLTLLPCIMRGRLLTVRSSLPLKLLALHFQKWPTGPFFLRPGEITPHENREAVSWRGSRRARIQTRQSIALAHTFWHSISLARTQSLSKSQNCSTVASTKRALQYSCHFVKMAWAQKLLLLWFKSYAVRLRPYGIDLYF